MELGKAEIEVIWLGVDVMVVVVVVKVENKDGGCSGDGW